MVHPLVDMHRSGFDVKLFDVWNSSQKLETSHEVHLMKVESDTYS